jgi:hypothetical protein
LQKESPANVRRCPWMSADGKFWEDIVDGILEALDGEVITLG